MGKLTAQENLPKIFYVNWFRKSQKGEFLWPGFGDNIRVLKWIIGRIEGTIQPRVTPIGYVPDADQLDLTDLSISEKALDTLLNVDRTAWIKEANDIEKYYEIYSDLLPDTLKSQLEQLKSRLEHAYKQSGFCALFV